MRQTHKYHLSLLYKYSTTQINAAEKTMSNQLEENPQNFYNPSVQAKILLQIHFLFNLRRVILCGIKLGTSLLYQFISLMLLRKRWPILSSNWTLE